MEKHQIQFFRSVAPLTGAVELKRQGRMVTDLIGDLGNKGETECFVGLFNDSHVNHSFGPIIRRENGFVNSNAAGGFSPAA